MSTSKQVQLEKYFSNLKKIGLDHEKSELNFDKYDIFCLDIDHTLALYKNCNLSILLWESFIEYMSNILDYPNLLSRKYEIYTKDKEKYYSLDILIDLNNGFALKISNDTTIKKAFHGLRELSNNEIEEIYSNKKYPFFDYKSTSTDHYKFISNWYLYHIIPLYLIYVELQKTVNLPIEIQSDSDEFRKIEKLKSLSFSNIVDDIYKSIVFNFNHFDLNTGIIDKCTSCSLFFKGIFQSPEKFLCNKFNSRDLLKSLKEKKKHIVFITNSAFEFSDFVLKNTIGDDYLDFCDLVIYFSNKPAFFMSQNDVPSTKTYFLDSKTNTNNGEEILYSHIQNSATDLSENDLLMYKKVLSYKQINHGNYKFIEWFFNIHFNQQGISNQIQYLMIGDSPISDCYYPNKLPNWKTVFVLSSFEDKTYKKVSIPHNFGEKWGKYLHFNEEDYDENDYECINDNSDKLNIIIGLIKKERIFVIPHVEYLDFLTN